MQVKKFEARTMKEALEMVKSQLGPDAIIMSAREIKKGLVGQESVEITAAISEATLQKKRFVESQLNDKEKEKFYRSSARVQKDVIEKLVNKHVQKVKQKTEAMQQRSRSASLRYIDIPDDSQNYTQDPVAIKQPPRAQTSQPVTVQQVTQHMAQQQSVNSAVTPLVQSKIKLNAENAWEDLKKNSDFEAITEQLVHQGVLRTEAIQLIETVQNEWPKNKTKDKNSIEVAVAKKIIRNLSIQHPQDSQKVHLFIGPSGSGKTSMLIKLASHMSLVEKKNIAILTTDTVKLGAVEQLKMSAEILEIPFVVIRGPEDWQHIAQGLDAVDAVLVDFPGLSLRYQKDYELLNHLLPRGIDSVQTHLVLSSLSKDIDIFEFCKRYSQVHFDDLIFTCLDETTHHGTLYNTYQKTKAPLFAFGIGTNIPDDFEYATKERVLDLIFKITQTHNQEIEVV